MIRLIVDCVFFFFQAEDGIRVLVRSRGLGDVYKSQFEHVGAPGPRLAEHFAGLGQRGLDAGEHDRRVEVALDGEATDPLSGLAERHPPVDADHVGAGLGEQAEQLAGANTEVCLLYTSPSPRDRTRSRMPSSA